MPSGWLLGDILPRISAGPGGRTREALNRKNKGARQRGPRAKRPLGAGRQRSARGRQSLRGLPSGPCCLPRPVFAGEVAAAALKQRKVTQRGVREPAPKQREPPRERARASSATRPDGPLTAVPARIALGFFPGAPGPASKCRLLPAARGTPVAS